LGKINKSITLNLNFFEHVGYVNKEESPYKPDPVLLRGITIHLDLQLLTDSSNLPVDSSEQLSNANCVVLLQAGFT